MVFVEVFSSPKTLYCRRIASEKFIKPSNQFLQGLQPFLHSTVERVGTLYGPMEVGLTVTQDEKQERLGEQLSKAKRKEDTVT